LDPASLEAAVEAHSRWMARWSLPIVATTADETAIAAFVHRFRERPATAAESAVG